MPQIVLTGHTGQNPRFPLPKLAAFIARRGETHGRAKKAIQRDMESVLLQGSGWNGFVLLDLDDQSRVQGVLVMLPTEEAAPAELFYLAADKREQTQIRKQLIRNALKISRGKIRMICELDQGEINWLWEEGFQFDPETQCIAKQEVQ